MPQLKLVVGQLARSEATLYVIMSSLSRRVSLGFYFSSLVTVTFTNTSLQVQQYPTFRTILWKPRVYKRYIKVGLELDMDENYSQLTKSSDPII